MGLILIFILIVFLVATVFAYNKAIILRNYTREAFSTMDVYLKKRWDLIPNLVKCTKGYAEYESNLFNEIANLRSQNYTLLSQEEKLELNMQLTESLPKITAVAENYPNLKANESFNNLMQQLKQIEDDIANSRKYYNGTVRELNTFLEVFPTNLIGKVFAIKKETMFEISSDQIENIEIGF